MHRELNPQLFANKPDKTPDSPGPLGASSKPTLSQQAQNYLPTEVRALENQVHTVKMGVSMVEKKLESMGLQMQEFARATATRFERFSQSLARLEEAMAQGNQELTNKYGTLTGKLNERRVNDGKIQEMVDRHNHIVRNFENRLTALQRTLSEQEMQLMASNATLDEARQEIMRLKRSGQ